MQPLIQIPINNLFNFRQQFSDIDVDMLGQLQDRDRQIVHLEHLLTAMQEEIQVTSVQLRFVVVHACYSCFNYFLVEDR